MPRNKEKPGPEVGRRRKPGTTDKNPGLVPHADGVRMCLGLGSGRTELSDLQKFLEQSYETATVGRALRAPWIRNSGRSEHSISVFSDQLPKRPADRPRVILLTGMVGLDKSDYCDRLAALARRQFAQDVAVVHVGREMYSLGRDILPGRILRVPLSRLTELRNQVNERIREHLKAGRHVIVNTHATFWWHNGVFLAFDDDTVKFWREVQPDTVVELVDNIYTIHARLLEEHDYVPQLNEVAAWRVRETVAAQSMAVFLSGAGSHFLIGRGRNEKEEAQSINALCKRLFGPPNLLVGYLTIPMTHVFDDPAIMAEIDHFGDQLAEKIIALRPEFVDEFLWVTKAEQALLEGKSEFTWPCLGKQRSYSSIDVALLGQQVEGEIISRDLKLISQCFALVGYMPTVKASGKPAISAGQQKEILHAMALSLHILLCYTPSRKPSPFDSKFGDLFVTDLERLLSVVPSMVEVIER